MSVNSATSTMQFSSKSIDLETRIYLRLLAGWHSLLMVASFIAAIYVGITPNLDLPDWLRWLLLGMMLISGAVNGIATYDIVRLRHHGRVISLIYNYILFVSGAVGLLHLLSVFNAIDNLADTFPRGIPYLGIVIAGYLVRTIGDRFENNRVGRHRLFMQVGGVLMQIGLGLFFVVAVLLPLANHVLTDWTFPYLAVIALAAALAAVLIRWVIPLPLKDTPAVVLALAVLGVVAFIAALILEFGVGVQVLLLVAAVLSGLMMWMMWRLPTAAAFGATITSSEMLEGFMFLSPNLLGFLLFFVGPLLFSLYISFTNSDGFGQQDFVGFRNYIEIFDVRLATLDQQGQLFSEVMDTTRYAELARFGFVGRHFVVGAHDKLFWISLWNTILFGLLTVPISVIPALLLAVILNSKLPGMAFFRAVYFLPSIAAVVGVALIWRWMYNSTVGWINYFITSIIVGINGLTGGTLADPQIGWLSETDVALLAVVIMTAWQWIGFNTVLFLAGLQGIPGDLYEAATVDGAGSWNRFWKITLPMLAPTTFFVLSTRIITAMQLFDQVFVMTNPPGGPGTSTMTITLHLYRNGFQNFQQGYASAIAWVLFLLILGLTLAQFQRERSTSAYEG